MNRNTFAKAMEMLGDQANEEQLREAKLKHRRKITSRVKMWCGFMIFVGAVAYGYVNREPLQNYVYDHFLKEDKGSVAETAARQTLSGVQAQADKRDSILNEIESKGAAPTAAVASTADTASTSAATADATPTK